MPEREGERQNRERRQAAHREYTSATDMTFERGRQDVLRNGDGFHTFDELYEFRMLYHAAFVNAWLENVPDGLEGPVTTKSLRHSDGELCFGGGWFIVVTELPTGQISNHYETKHWDLFKVPAVERPQTYDGHTASDVVFRLRAYLEGQI